MELNKRYYNHKGVDLKSSELIRPPEYASDMLNAQYTEGGALEKRPGYQGHALSAGGYGTWTYQRVHPMTGVADPRVVTVDANLWELHTATLTVTYAGADPTAVISIFFDIATTAYRVQILEGTVMILDTTTNVGFDEASPKTLAQLAVQINALTGFSATVTGLTSTPAAFLKIVREHDLNNDGPLIDDAKYWVMVNTPTSNPLSLYYANRFQPDHENVSTIQTNNVIYFGSGFSETMKYDGQNFYRAGLPNVGTVSSALVAGAVTGNNYVHKIQYANYDAAGNIIEGNLASTVVQNAVANSFNLTIPQIEDSTGFNTNCAIVNGIQAGVTTITVDDGTGGPHTLQVGDTAYFFDGVATAYTTRLVTARTPTTITIAGAPVNVADNSVISNNLRIIIWRSKSSGATPAAFFFVDEIPNNSFVASVVYNDNLIDSALGELLLTPVTDRSPPPKGRYVSQWNGIMIVGGNMESPTSLYYSDVDGPEFFPNDSNQLFIEPGNGDVITGIAANNEVFTVHGNQSFTAITGDITTGQIRVETKARDAGCVAHATLVDIDGVLCWLSPQGPRQSSGGQVPIPLGAAIDESESNQASRIDPVFDNSGRPEPLKVRGKRALGFNDTVNDKYLLFVPKEDGDNSLRYPNLNSRVYVYDRVRDAWLIWSNYNIAGGITYLGTELYLVERRYSTFSSTVQSILYRRLDLLDAYDYADNTTGIACDYSPQWEALGQPSVLKDPLKIRVFSLEAVANNQFTLTIEQEINYQTDSAIATFDMQIAGGGYGYSPYGETAYSDPAQDAAFHSLGRSRIRSVRPRFKNNVIHENISVTGWEIEFATPFREEFKP